MVELNRCDMLGQTPGHRTYFFPLYTRQGTTRPCLSGFCGLVCATSKYCIYLQYIHRKQLIHMRTVTKTLASVPDTTAQCWSAVKPTLTHCALLVWRWL